MSDTVIKVQNLSKRYRIGVRRQGYRTFRETLVDTVKAPFQRAKAAWSMAHSAWNKKKINSLPTPGSMPSSFEDTIWALKDISFEVKQGDVVGIIGRNGAGKSTLLKILSKITEPTEGRIELSGRVGSLLEVGTGFHPELTGHENVYLYGAILGMNRWEVTRKFDEIVAFAEIEKFIETPVKRYSSGMYMRLAFAVAAYLETEILLVDEVLAVGDAAFQKKCLSKMGDVSKKGRTVLFVSHNMSAIQHLCIHALYLERGKVRHSGTVSETVKLYEGDLLSKGSDDGLPSNVIYDHRVDKKRRQLDFEIVRIELFDKEGHPKNVISTWDTVIFRFYCQARYRIQAGSVVLQISNLYGVPLLLCSTQPDSAVPVVLQEGQTIVECEFASFPLSAGEYVIGAGLAIPNKEWLYKEDQAALFSVHPRDVYHSGMAPVASRSIVATPHVWKVI